MAMRDNEIEGDADMMNHEQKIVEKGIPCQTSKIE